MNLTNGKQRMHLKNVLVPFPFNESNVIKKKKLQKTGKYMYGRQVDIKKYVSAMFIFA